MYCESFDVGKDLLILRDGEDVRVVPLDRINFAHLVEYQKGTIARVDLFFNGFRDSIEFEDPREQKKFFRALKRGLGHAN